MQIVTDLFSFYSADILTSMKQDENQENYYLEMRRSLQQRKLSYRNLLNKIEGIRKYLTKF